MFLIKKGIEKPKKSGTLAVKKELKKDQAYFE